MADYNHNHLKILRRGVKVWNQWRKDNPDIRPNLRTADLRTAELYSANLRRVNLYKANLYSANLRRANLYSANLWGANLRLANLYSANLWGANLRLANLKGSELEEANLYSTNLEKANLEKANLEKANLKGLQAISTNFKGAILTGACIEDWNINSKTNLQNVECDYIYLNTTYSKEEGKEFYGDRRPHDPDKIFVPGEFTKLFQKALETVDLLFREGVDWKAVAYSLKKIQVLNEDTPLTIKKIENKGDGDLLISVNVPENTNKGKIEGDFWRGYEFAHKALEGQYQARIEDKQQEINRLFSLVNQQSEQIGESQKLLAEANKTINIDEGSYYEQSGKFGIGHNQGEISGDAEVTGQS